MRKLTFAIVLLLAGCAVKDGKKSDKGAGLVDTININDEDVQADEETELDEGLNGIRFENFTAEDWVDNEYIKAYRAHIDDYIAGRIEDESLDEYKDKIRGKFIVGNSSPFIAGGLFLQVIFIDYPEYLFNAWIYSDVDVKTRTVSNYDVRSTKLSEEKMDFTKEQILEDLKTHPELKLW